MSTTAKRAQEWAQGVANNMARDPEGGDTDQILALPAVSEPRRRQPLLLRASAVPDDAAKREAAREVIFPNQDDRGTHVNGGAGLVANAQTRKTAFASWSSWPLTKRRKCGRA